MNDLSVLHNVNQILVQPGLERDYIHFSKCLNSYLKKKYERYYIGLQLYKNKEISNEFFVVADYKDIPGVYEAAKTIGNDISRIYDKVWRDSVKRISVLAFVDYKRVIPKYNKK